MHHKVYKTHVCVVPIDSKGYTVPSLPVEKMKEEMKRMARGMNGWEGQWKGSGSMARIYPINCRWVHRARPPIKNFKAYTNVFWAPKSHRCIRNQSTLAFNDMLTASFVYEQWVTQHRSLCHCTAHAIHGRSRKITILCPENVLSCADVPLAATYKDVTYGYTLSHNYSPIFTSWGVCMQPQFNSL